MAPSDKAVRVEEWVWTIPGVAAVDWVDSDVLVVFVAEPHLAVARAILDREGSQRDGVRIECQPSRRGKGGSAGSD